MTTEIVRIKRCQGLTLVELLMVVSIMTILLVVAIPMIRPAFQDRNLREAARMVNAFFASAKARAAESGRPVGVWIERLDGSALGARTAQRLYVAEVAPSFAGTTLWSRAGVVEASGELVFSAGDAAALVSLLSSSLPIMNPENPQAGGSTFQIRFDFKGPWYTAERRGGGFFWADTRSPPPGAKLAAGLPYQVQLMPRRSIASPLTLPSDTVIDLSVSGSGTGGNHFDPVLVPSPPDPPSYDPLPIIIMFHPNGDVAYVYRGELYPPLPLPGPYTTRLSPSPLFGAIHILIGRRSNVVNPAMIVLPDDPDNPRVKADSWNLADPTSLWVTVGHRSGAVSTADNTSVSWSDVTSLSNGINTAREFARTSIQKGGR